GVPRGVRPRPPATAAAPRWGPDQQDAREEPTGGEAGARRRRAGPCAVSAGGPATRTRHCMVTAMWPLLFTLAVAAPPPPALLFVSDRAVSVSWSGAHCTGRGGRCYGSSMVQTTSLDMFVPGAPRSALVAEVTALAPALEEATKQALATAGEESCTPYPNPSP